MANPAVTYTFTNSTTADADQVNQNFTDIINALTDGTKSLTIDALTVGGTFTANGAINLGDASTDDLTITASLASTIPIKTTYSYDIGASAVGIKDLYFGSDDSAAFTSKIKAGTVGSNTVFTLPQITMTMPTADGSAYDLMRTNGSGAISFLKNLEPNYMSNVGLSVSMGSGAATISLTQGDGSTAADSSNPALIAFRNSTATTGGSVLRAVTSSLTVVVSSGSTLGTANGVAARIYIYAIDNAGTVELAVSRVQFRDESAVTSTTAEGGAGAADDAGVLYSTTTRSNVAFRLIGYFDSTQATAGTWSTAASAIYCGNKVPRQEIFCELLQGTGQSLTHATLTKLTNFTANEDNLDQWDGTNDRYVIKKAGRYTVDFACYIGDDGDFDITLCRLEIYLGGSPIAVMYLGENASNGGLYMGQVSKTMTFAKDDQITFYAYQSNSNTSTLSTLGDGDSVYASIRELPGD